jgi:hypothetical protein
MNFSYSGGSSKKILTLRPAQAKLVRPSLRNEIKAKRAADVT